MILTYASQLDYDGMAGNPGDHPAWSGEDFAAMRLHGVVHRRPGRDR